MAALKMAALGPTPSAAMRWNSSSASCHCPALSAAQTRLVYVIALRRCPLLICAALAHDVETATRPCHLGCA